MSNDLLKRDQKCYWCEKTDELNIMIQDSKLHTVCVNCGTSGPIKTALDVRVTIAALRAENERLKKEKRELVEAIKESIKTCNGINTADYRTWEDGLNTKDEFIVWSKSRCGWQSDRLTAAVEKHRST